MITIDTDPEFLFNVLILYSFWAVLQRAMEYVLFHSIGTGDSSSFGWKKAFWLCSLTGLLTSGTFHPNFFRQLYKCNLSVCLCFDI